MENKLYGKISNILSGLAFPFRLLHLPIHTQSSVRSNVKNQYAQCAVHTLMLYAFLDTIVVVQCYKILIIIYTYAHE